MAQESSEEPDLLKAFLGQAQASESSDGNSALRRYTNPKTGETGPYFLIPPKAPSAEAWEAKHAITMQEQDRRRVPPTPIDPSAIATAGGKPIPDYGKASRDKNDKTEPARSSTQIRFVR